MRSQQGPSDILLGPSVHVLDLPDLNPQVLGPVVDTSQSIEDLPQHIVVGV